MNIYYFNRTTAQYPEYQTRDFKVAMLIRLLDNYVYTHPYFINVYSEDRIRDYYSISTNPGVTKYLTACTHNSP